MRDRNPASPSKMCPKCNTKNFRLCIGTMFVRVYGCYCKNCGYKTEASVSDELGCKEWFEAKGE